jgi:SAM-dependent methyltransferase
MDPSYFPTKGAGLKVQPKVTTALSSSSCSDFPSRDESRILILGCGNSTLGEDMMRDGWKGEIVNVDFSEAVISQMKAKYNDAFYSNLYGEQGSSAIRKMQFICADVTERLPFSSESFDLIICKGSFDAVLCGSKVRGVVAELHRVLARGHGIFFLVTNGNPDSRLEYLEHKNDINHYWQGVNVHTVPPLGSVAITKSHYNDK